MGFKFEVKVSPFNEEGEEPLIQHLTPKKIVEYLALSKARASAKKNKKAVIIGADTTVDLKGKSIGKPKDKKEAREMMKKLSGSSHFIHTSYVIIDSESGKTLQKTDKSEVKFREISDEELDRYLKKAKVSDKAGGYAIQEEGGEFVEYTKGDYLSIVGLPSSIKEDLQKFGINPK
jgi:septum formation protein